MVTINNCPVCQSNKVSFVFELRDYFLTKEFFKMYECNQCELRFISPIPDESMINAYYASEDYISHSNKSKGLFSWIYQIVRSITITQKRRLVVAQSKLKQGKILDIGCGTGEFLNEMKSYGWESNGVEPNTEALKQAKDLYELNVFLPDQLSTFDDNSFDVITLWHVLEHIHQLDNYLENIKRLIRKSGVVIIALPNYKSADAMIYGKIWAGYDVPRHLYHFTPHAFSVLMERFQLKVTAIKPMHFDPFYVSLLSEKYKDKGHIVSAFINGFMSFFSALFDTKKSSSLIYVITQE